MGVRVKLRIRSKEREMKTSALVNTGFESDLPEVLLPFRAAEAPGPVAAAR